MFILPQHCVLLYTYIYICFFVFPLLPHFISYELILVLLPLVTGTSIILSRRATPAPSLILSRVLPSFFFIFLSASCTLPSFNYLRADWQQGILCRVISIPSYPSSFVVSILSFPPLPFSLAFHLSLSLCSHGHFLLTNNTVCISFTCIYDDRSILYIYVSYIVQSRYHRQLMALSFFSMQN